MQFKLIIRFVERQ